MSLHILALLVAGILPVTSSVGPVIAQTSCVSLVKSQMHSMGANIDDQKAVALATESSLFKQKTQGFDAKFNSVFTVWSFDRNCIVTLKSVNVAFTLFMANGTARYALEIGEDASPTRVTNATLLPAMYASGNTLWAGYEFLGSANPPGPGAVPVYEATGSWTAPTVTEPSSGACASTICNLAIWPGLEDCSGGCTGIVQAGGAGQVYSGTTSYTTWYELYPQPLFQCFTSTATASLYVDIFNHGATGGNNVTYDITILDNTNHLSCGTTGQYFGVMGIPFYGAFIAERPVVNGNHARLPAFGSISMQGNVFYNGALQSISNPYSNGWYQEYDMVNCPFFCYTNIATGSVSSGAFYWTYQSSTGT